MTITTDYTAKANANSMRRGTAQQYRLVHWLKDILKNFLCDPVNIKDERISKLLRLQDGASEETLRALFTVGLPYSKDSIKAGITPAIIVSLGDTAYPHTSFNSLPPAITSEIGSRSMSSGVKYKAMGCGVSVLTESYDGTILLCGLVEDFLNINENLLLADSGMLSEFKVTGSSAPQELKAGGAHNAKTIYQSTIKISTLGGISWSTDTQGPVFRGLTAVQR